MEGTWAWSTGWTPPLARARSEKAFPEGEPSVGTRNRRGCGPGQRECSLQLTGRLPERPAGQALPSRKCCVNQLPLLYFLSVKLTLRSLQQPMGPCDVLGQQEGVAWANLCLGTCGPGQRGLLGLRQTVWMLLETNCDRNLEAILPGAGRGQAGTIVLGMAGHCCSEKLRSRERRIS